jgi:hypothetical protein
VIAANRAITKSLVDNEGAFKNLGVATRDTNGGFRNSLDIMLEVNQKLLTFREGTDRNIEGQKIYKKAWEEVRPVLKLTTDLMVESRDKAAALGLALGKESVESIERYKAAQNDAKDVTLALSKAVSEAVMPVMTEMLNDMATTGPQKVEALRAAMGYLVAAFYSAKTVIVSIWEVVKGFFQTIGIGVGTMAEVVAGAATGDWRRVVNAVRTQFDALKDVAKTTGSSISAEFEKNADRTASAFERAFSKPTTTRTARTGGAGSSGGEDKASMQKWDAELAAARNAFEQQKLLEGSFQVFSKAQERDFWQAKIGLTQEGTKTRAEVDKRYYDAEREVRKQAFEAQIAQIHAEVESFRAGTAQRVSLANKAAVEIGARYGYESKEYLDAVGKANAYAREFADKQRELAATRLETEQQYQASRVELERANVETLFQLGQLNAAQRLEALKNLKEIEYQINLKGLESQAEQYADDEVEYAKHLQRLAALKNKHELDMKQIDGQIKVESFRVWREIGDAVTGAFSTAVKGVIMGTQTISQAMRNMAQSILLALIDMGVKWLAQQALNALIGAATEKAARGGEGRRERGGGGLGRRGFGGRDPDLRLGDGAGCGRRDVRRDHGMGRRGGLCGAGLRRAEGRQPDDPAALGGDGAAGGPRARRARHGGSRRLTRRRHAPARARARREGRAPLPDRQPPRGRSGRARVHARVLPGSGGRRCRTSSFRR